MKYITRFLRAFGFVAALGASAFLSGCGNEERPTVNNQSLFSSIKDDEPGLLDGNLPILYGVFCNNTNNTSGYLEMATLHRSLAAYEKVSGFKVVGDKLYLRVEVSDPSKTASFTDNGGPKTPDYVGIVDSSGSVIRDFDGVRRYAELGITPLEAFQHAGFFFNTHSLPTNLDPVNPPPKISNIFNPNNPTRPGIDRVNYGSLQNPIQVNLPTGPVHTNLFIEGQPDRLVDFDPTPADRQAIEDFKKHPAYDPNQLKVSFLDKLTRHAVDMELFGD